MLKNEVSSINAICSLKSLRSLKHKTLPKAITVKLFDCASNIGDNLIYTII